jgi:cysteine rich repeat protein
MRGTAPAIHRNSASYFSWPAASAEDAPVSNFTDPTHPPAAHLIRKEFAMMCRLPFLRTAQALLPIIATVCMAADALAQQPSQAQVNAVRQSCRNDYMAHCSSVPAGGAAALNCLQQHAASLSGACQQAVGAIKGAAPKSKAAAAPAAAPPPAAAPAPPPAAPAAAPAVPAAPAKAPAAQSKKAALAAMRRACGADFRVHCHGIPPGGGAAIACLKRNAMTLSPACQHVLAAAAAHVPAAARAPAAAPALVAAPAPVAAPPVAPAPVAAAPVAVPVEPAPLLVSPREEMFILRTSCGADYARFCRGLRFGMGRIASCLHYNAANLSPACQAALYALREGR